jgi:hypothetical protein
MQHAGALPVLEIVQQAARNQQGIRILPLLDRRQQSGAAARQ